MLGNYMSIPYRTQKTKFLADLLSIVYFKSSGISSVKVFTEPIWLFTKASRPYLFDLLI